jgi:hypothetical protein
VTRGDRLGRSGHEVARNTRTATKLGKKRSDICLASRYRFFAVEMSLSTFARGRRSPSNHMYGNRNLIAHLGGTSTRSR